MIFLLKPIQKEKAIAEFLEGQGRVTVKNELEGLAGAGRQGDAFVDGVKTEFKALEPKKNGAPTTDKTIDNLVHESRRHGGQAEHIVIDARNVDISEELARNGTYKALGSSNNLKSIEVIGKDYHFVSVPKNQ